MAMHSAVLLASENNELRQANIKRSRKQGVERTYVGHGGTLTAQEGRLRVQAAVELVEEVSREASPTARQCAPKRCSICRSLEHTARTCQ